MENRAACLGGDPLSFRGFRVKILQHGLRCDAQGPAGANQFIVRDDAGVVGKCG